MPTLIMLAVLLAGCSNYQRDIRRQYHIGKITWVQHGDRIDFYEDGKWIDVWDPE